MRISVFGLGYVGCVSIGCLARNGHDIIGVDTSQIKVSQINEGKATIIENDIDSIIKEEFNRGRIRATSDYKDAVLNSDVSILAVGTPSSSTGHLNLDYIFTVAENIGSALKDKNSFHVIAIRSTVLPGTAKKVATLIENISGKKNDEDFAVVSNPEFLREGTAVHDYYNPPLTLVGTSNKKAAETISVLYDYLPCELIVAENEVAEIMKYVNNSFHALKVSFANEIGNICQALQIDSHKVMEIFCKDKVLNISPYYLKPGFAYGGSCLPKDLKALQTLSHDLYLNTPVINQVSNTNNHQIERAIDIIVQRGFKKLGFLGLSFKAGTDDLRNSPAVFLIETLLGKGFDIQIYDKNIELSRLLGKNKEYIDTHIPHLSKLLVNNIDTLVEKSELIIINNKEQDYLDNLSGHLDSIHLIDMVRLPEEFRKAKYYMGINW